MENILATATKMTLDRLTDDELCQLVLAMGFGEKPHDEKLFQKVKSLYTPDGKMHSAAQEIVYSIANKRLEVPHSNNS
jgi:hypothetical protein